MIYIVTNRKQSTFNYLKPYATPIIQKENGWSKTKIKKSDTIMYYFQYEVNVSKIPKLPLHSKMIGHPKGVLACRNKKEMRRLFIEKGINVPKTWFKIEDAVIPFIARPRYHHMGKLLFVARTEEEKSIMMNDPAIGKDWYFSELLDLTHEFRIILFNYEVILAYEFPLYGSVEETVLKRLEYRGTNLAAKQIPTNIPRHYEDLAIKAMKTIELGFGGLDLLVDRKGNIYISEVNNSPTMYKVIRDALKKAIIKYSEE